MSELSIRQTQRLIAYLQTPDGQQKLADILRKDETFALRLFEGLRREIQEAEDIVIREFIWVGEARNATNWPQNRWDFLDVFRADTDATTQIPLMNRFAGNPVLWGFDTQTHDWVGDWVDPANADIWNIRVRRKRVQ